MDYLNKKSNHIWIEYIVCIPHLETIQKLPIQWDGKADGSNPLE